MPVNSNADSNAINLIWKNVFLSKRSHYNNVEQFEIVRKIKQI